ncbi:MAG: hypothetical protein K2L97_01585 [Muribaculaceae bacterium]|nr:hypothetical protein [Muribaculaceae bacterium]
MKKHIKAISMTAIAAFIFIACICVSSCQDSPLPSQEYQQSEYSTQLDIEDIPIIAVSSRTELKAIIDQITDQHSRDGASDYLRPSNFESLIEANIRKIKESLTEDQLREIEEEGLEICPSDSVIADIKFASLLNANREIQVADTVYRYFQNGVAYTKVETARQLRLIDDIVNNIIVDEKTENKAVPITSNIDFIPIYNLYAVHVDQFEDPNGGGCPGTVPPPFSHSGWNLNSGTFIYDEDTRLVDYNSRGDGNTFHYALGRIFGRDISAIKYFNDGTKLLLKVYDQNYIIYSNIGTTLKLQKEKFGFWCDAKAQEMEHGWDPVIIKYTLPNPIPPETFIHPDFSNPTISTNLPSPFTIKNRIILRIPWINFNLSEKDLNKAFSTACTAAFDKASSWFRQQCGDPENMDLMCFENKEVYFIHGPYWAHEYNTKGMKTLFYSKWFPGSFSITFSLGSSFSVKDIHLSTSDGVELYRCCIYGAVKHNGLWKAAKIYKHD